MVGKRITPSGNSAGAVKQSKKAKVQKDVPVKTTQAKVVKKGKSNVKQPSRAIIEQKVPEEKEEEEKEAEEREADQGDADETEQAEQEVNDKGKDEHTAKESNEGKSLSSFLHYSSHPITCHLFRIILSLR